MRKRKWHKGPPPHIGWWNASAWRFGNIWRWWDGEKWSRSVRNDAEAVVASVTASIPSSQEDIEWTDYWPKNARVPRIDPREGV